MLTYIEIIVGLAVLFLMSRVVTGVRGERAYRRATVFIGVILISAALTILTIGARSPYTHANLGSGYDPRYDRTAQIGVNDDAAFAGFGPDTSAGNPDLVAHGASLYVTKGCVTCHALEGRGGPVGPAISGTSAATIERRARAGSGGMPRFDQHGLTADEIAALTAFLKSFPTPAK